jgi:hypothetical protein
MPKRFRSDDKDWILINRDLDDEEPEYETINIAEVVNELQGLDELSVLGSETTMTHIETVINDDTSEIINETRNETEKQQNEFNEDSSITHTHTSTIIKSDSSVENPHYNSLSSSSTTMVTKTNLLPPLPLPFIQQQKQQQQFWSFEEKLAAETVANLVAPGDFINGSDCAIFLLFDKAITHHTVAKPLQENEKDDKNKTTQALLNLQDKSESIFNKEKDEIYYKIKQAVVSRLQIE